MCVTFDFLKPVSAYFGGLGLIFMAAPLSLILKRQRIEGRNEKRKEGEMEGIGDKTD